MPGASKGRSAGRWEGALEGAVLHHAGQGCKPPAASALCHTHPLRPGGPVKSITGWLRLKATACFRYNYFPLKLSMEGWLQREGGSCFASHFFSWRSLGQPKRENTPIFLHLCWAWGKFSAEHLKYLRQDSSFPLRAEIPIFAAGRLTLPFYLME